MYGFYLHCTFIETKNPLCSYLHSAEATYTIMREFYLFGHASQAFRVQLSLHIHRTS
jgi:hypothetical protein